VERLSGALVTMFFNPLAFRYIYSLSRRCCRSGGILNYFILSSNLDLNGIIKLFICLFFNRDRTYALQNEKSCKGGFIQTLGNKRKISKKTRPYDGLGIDCVSPKRLQFRYNSQFASFRLFKSPFSANCPKCDGKELA
jgi:hypothetical protein